MASADGGQQQGGGSQLLLSDDEGGHMPQHFSIGTRKAIANNDAYSYEKKHLEAETIYVCDKGSRYARENEVLVLRRKNNIWTAFDCLLSGDGKIRHQRQPVFRSHDGDDITLQGSHNWQMNDAASVGNDDSEEEWGGTFFRLKPGMTETMMHQA